MVIIAFVATALLTICAIIFGYLAKALSGTYTNEVDDLLIETVKSPFRKCRSHGDPEKNEMK